MKFYNAFFKLKGKFRLACVCLLVMCCAQAKGQNTAVDTVYNAQQLDSVFRMPVDTISVYLMPGDYHLTAKEAYDTSLVNIPDTNFLGVPHTYGLRIKGKKVTIKGSPAYSSIIYTHAGYGIFFDSCKDAVIEGVILTGGIRDSDARATDAAIVARSSSVKILNNLIFENIGDTNIVRKTEAGVMGICGREGADLFIFNNQVGRNSWHGIAILSGAEATITGNIVDGVDKASLDTIRGGRGIGILITRDAKATLETNVVKRYWKGIGIFVNAEALVSGNLIEDIATWGIAVWDADTGRPVARIEKNVIYKTGACGFMLRRYLEDDEDPGYFRNNIVVETAINRKFDNPDLYCYQCAMAIHGRAENFKIEGNTFYKNFWLAPCFGDLDVSVGQFITGLQKQYSTLPLQWYAGYSEFIQRFFFYTGS